jgi:hypothetical protein
MIKQYTAHQGQTIYDVCLMTYGSLGSLFKLMQDNSFPGVNNYPYAGQKFNWDDTLVFDEKVYITNSTAGINYATRQGINGSINYNIISGDVPSQQPNVVPPINPNPSPSQGLGYFYVYSGSPGLSVDGDGNLVYTDSRLNGLTNYAIYADQVATFLEPLTQVSYGSGSFTILIPGFEIVSGYKLTVFLGILPPL